MFFVSFVHTKNKVIQVETIKKIKEAFGNASDLIIRDFQIGECTIYLVQNDVLCNSSFINEYILDRLTNLSLTKENEEFLLYNFLPDNSVIKVKDLDQMIDFVCKGFALLIYEEEKGIAIEAKASLDRGIGEANSESTIRGSKDAFNENFNTNLGLIRRRLRCEHCFMETLFLGKESRAKTGILYMNDIALKENVETVKKKLERINVDGVFDSGSLKRYLEEKHNFLFPTVLATERPDRAAQALLEGKIVIITDNSPFALITPTFFVDYLHSPDDYYQRSFHISFLRIIRLLAFLIAIFTPALYIALTTHNQDMLPFDLLLNFAAQRESVPFSALTEALFMSISFEILRESDIRKPASMGSAVSILGGLILGDAAVSAGIISPIMIIVISISAISGLAFTSQEMISSLRWLRFIMMFLAMFFGIFGIFWGAIFLLASLTTTTTLNLPYFAPISPLVKEELGDSLIKSKNKKIRKRNPLLTKNKVREREREKK